MKVFTVQDVQASQLQGQRVCVVGYGSQGRAHALNLRESGVDVVLGLRPGGASFAQAEAEGWSESMTPLHLPRTAPRTSQSARGHHQSIEQQEAAAKRF